MNFAMEPASPPKMEPASPPKAVVLLCLFMGLAVPIAALALDVVEHGQHVALRFAPALVLPPTCASRALFGVDCPACGLTRSIIFLAHGGFAESLAMHRFGWLVFALILAQIPYRICQLRGNVGLLAKVSRAEPWIWGLLAVLLVLNRVWDLFVAL